MILEDIKQKFKLINAYEDWKDYRQLLTDLIIEAGCGESSKSVTVVGAGYCNDIDIKRLCRHFERIRLVDCDPEAMAVFSNKLADSEAEKVKLLPLSLTGIEEQDISGFFEDTLIALKRFGKNLTCVDFEEVLMSKLDRLLDKTITSKEELIKRLPEGDIVLCNGVCSQLFSVISFFIRSIAGSIPEALFTGAADVAERAEQKLKSKNDKVIPLICRALFKTAGDCVIFGNEYSKEKPVEGAQRCIETVRNSGHVLKETEAVWHFNRKENVNYNMLLQICDVGSSMD